MYYTIYKITNKINGKIYIGKHQTKNLNDDYMGSGKLIRKAIEKYGIDKFSKELIHIFDNEIDMNNMESILVTEDFCNLDTNYNLCPGGLGGFGYLNNNYWTPELRYLHCIAISPFHIGHNLGCKFTPETSKQANMKRSALINEGKLDPRTFLGKTHTEETKNKMRKSKNVGDTNSQYGSKWIYSLEERKCIKIKNSDPIPEGWVLGRKMKF